MKIMIILVCLTLTACTSLKTPPEAQVTMGAPQLTQSAYTH